METLQPTEPRAAFIDCPLVEIVHFHDCLRGEVQLFAAGTARLRSIVGSQGSFSKEAIDLENQLHSQFHSLRRVFQAHSKAEDDLIWPALREKAGADGVAPDSLECALEEDHSDEECLFTEIEGLLALLEKGCKPEGSEATLEASRLLTELEGLASRASENMFRHLQREETEVLPLIQRCFSREEMARLVGSILGERPGELMDTILAMMFRNLSPESRADMLRHVKHAVDGTFFDRWLSYVRIAHQGPGMTAESAGDGAGKVAEAKQLKALSIAELMACEELKHSTPSEDAEAAKNTEEEVLKEETVKECRMCQWVGRCPRESKLEPKEFESAVRAIARDATLGMIEKSNAVQILRSCSWAGSQYKRPKAGAGSVGGGGGGGAAAEVPPSSSTMNDNTMMMGVAATAVSPPMIPPPSHLIGAFLGLNGGNAVIPPLMNGVRSSSSNSNISSNINSNKPTTTTGGGAAAASSSSSSSSSSADAMAPTYTPSGDLGCRHYRRACKLRAECCGRLFTCRLCHDESTADHAMDRYAVKEVLCMRCGELQPVGQYCRSEACVKSDQPLSTYYCAICRLYDDDADKEIYHCPYCNVCRLGKGLGIDFRHCMTCNACVSLKVAPERHKCIEQALQRDCPVCNEPLFTSTTHYKVLDGCGHSMHRECFQAYRQTAYTCPICKKSMEDMTSHFASLDLLMQAYPMPPEFASWRSHILCQDCGEESQDVPYHFCYHKCSGCGSYNTRVLSARDLPTGEVTMSASSPVSGDRSGRGGGGGSSASSASASST